MAGTVVAAALLEGARRPAYRLRIDFGPELGQRDSSAQLVDLYEPADLIGRQVIALVDLGPRRIAGFVSEVLVLGLPSPGGVVLLEPERPVEDGSAVF
jgi:tRNA-binding protein